jgi:hypothetical protein
MVLIGLLGAALVASVFFPWRQTVIGTSPASSGRTLSSRATTHDLATVVHTLAAQTVFRVAVELLVLGAAIVVVAMCGRALITGRAASPIVLISASVTCVVLTGLAAFALPTIHQSARLTFFPTFRATAACYVAFVISAFLLVASVTRRTSNPAGAVAAGHAWA